MPDEVKKPNAFVEFLTHNFLGIVILILGCLGFYYMHERLGRNEAAMADTLVQMKTLANGVVVMKGNIESAAEIEKQARISMGREFMTEVKATNGSVTSLHTLIGDLKSSIEKFGKIIGDKQPDGSFTTTIPQDRGDGVAPLTSVSLKYDSSKKTLTEALSASSWNNNKEQFTINFGEWRTDNDGIRSAASLKRTIFKDDNKTQKLGEEIIPLTSAEAYYSRDNIQKLASPPKYTWIGGTIHDSATGKNGFIGIIDTSLNRSLGISTGVAIIGGNKNYILGASIKFGKQ